jgi:hypothetical protein
MMAEYVPDWIRNEEARREHVARLAELERAVLNRARNWRVTLLDGTIRKGISIQQLLDAVAEYEACEAEHRLSKDDDIYGEQAQNWRREHGIT